MMPEEMFENEKKLILRAKSSMIKLPFESIDVLVLGEIGKNISGKGMDTKVVGQIMLKGQKDPKVPKTCRIVVQGLTPRSHCNTEGIGPCRRCYLGVIEDVALRSTAFDSFAKPPARPVRVEKGLLKYLRKKFLA